MIPTWARPNRLGVLISSALFMWPASDFGQGAVSLAYQKGSGSATFTRATTATTVLSNGNVGYLGLNLALQSQTFDNATWAAISAKNVVANTDVAPDGSFTADTLTDNSAAAFQGIRQLIAVANDSVSRVISVHVKKTSGGTSPTFGLAISYSGGTPVSSTPRFNTDTGQVLFGSGFVSDNGNGYWRFYTALANNSTGNTNLNFDIYPATAANGSGIDVVTATGSAVIWGAQMEVGTVPTGYGVTTTVANSAARAFYEACPAGSVGKSLYVNGTVSPTLPYASMPDSVSVSVTGDLDMRALVAPDSYVPSVTRPLISKLRTLGQYSYDWAINSSARFRFRYSPDGTAIRIADCTAAIPFADNFIGGVRVTYTAATGAVLFYTSTDWINWTQLGAQVNLTAGQIFDGTDNVRVGFDGLSTTSFNGNIYRAQIYNGINGTLVADFNPANTTQGATSFVSSSTGETWTINGSAYVYGTPGYRGYLPEVTATNLCLQSETFDNAAWAKASSTVTANALYSPDGVLTGDTLTATAANGLITQTIVKAAAATQYTQSLWCKSGSRTTGIIYLCSDAGLANGYSITFNTVTGVVGAPVARGAGWSAASSMVIVYPNGWFRFILTATSDTVAAVVPAVGHDAGAVNGDTLNIWGIQLETGGVASTYIPTTTVAVTRNSDNLTLPTAGNYSNLNGSFYCEGWLEVDSNVNSGGQRTFAGEGTAGNTWLGYYQPNGRPTIYDGTTAAAIITTVPAKTTAKLGTSWGFGGNIAVYLNGGSKAVAAFDNNMALTSIGVGHINGTAHFNGGLKNFILWGRQLTDAEQATLAAGVI